MIIHVTHDAAEAPRRLINVEMRHACRLRLSARVYQYSRISKLTVSVDHITCIGTVCAMAGTVLLPMHGSPKTPLADETDSSPVSDLSSADGRCDATRWRS